MRGKACAALSHSSPPRITPAHAGKRQRGRYRTSKKWDHPCTCGEKRDGNIAHACRGGSPLHMRGKAKKRPVLNDLLGITPAHAGKRSRSSGFPDAPWDHPCTCGEKDAVANVTSPWLGSPLHMRGKAEHKNDLVNMSGITPAHAGKRFS